jgi:cytochrome c553
LFAQMQTEAGHFEEATTLTEAGTALARTLTRCGGCHRVSQGGPEIGIPPLPEGDSVAAHMQRHRWAADRMWEGLVKDDAEIYGTGAAALREASLFESEIEDRANTEAPRERVRAIANLVHELGAEAATAETPTDRADVYGRLLATCATCHRMLGVGDAVAEGEGLAPAGGAAEGATEGE